MTHEIMNPVDLDAQNTHVVDLTVDAVRAYLDGDTFPTDDFDNALDEAQGALFTEEHKVAFVVLRITKSDG